MMPLYKSNQNNMNNQMGFNNQNMINQINPNANQNMMNQMQRYSYQNLMMPIGMMNMSMMNNNNINMLNINNMNKMNNNTMDINNQNNYFNLHQNFYQNQNMNNKGFNQNMNNMNQNMNNNNANPINNIVFNTINENQLLNNKNDLNINVLKETLYDEPINYQVSEETKKLLNNNEISRGSLISNLASVSPTLQCPICLDLVMIPVECKNCSKIFCKYCIDNWLKNSNECPNKHSFEKREELDEWIKIALGKIYLKCPFIGCGSDYAYKYWKDHVKKCIFKYKGCIKINDKVEDGEELFSWKPIQFFVKDIHGHSHVFNLPLSTTVKELKEKLEEKTGFKVEAQRLTCGGKTMDNNKLLEFYGLQPNQTIFQLGRLKGGNLIL